MSAKQNRKIFISFIGTNDAGKLNGKPDGAILTALKALKKADEVYLLWSPSDTFKNISAYLKKEIIKRKLSHKVNSIPFDLDDVTDHNEIYPKLLDFCKVNLPVNPEIIAAIASGTPAMQVCWILMAESGDFRLKLIRSNEPKFGKPPVTEIKLGTGLPKIIRLESENKDLKKLLPIVNLNIPKGELKIGSVPVKLSPVQFAYYRYFIERAKEEKEYERFGNTADTPKSFLKKIIEFHKESFPDAYMNIKVSENILEKGYGADIRTFRANISKLNNKIKTAMVSYNYYIIETEGSRFRTCYGISLPPEKINII